MSEEQYIEFKVIWWDQDIVELRARCSSGPFAGMCELYALPDALKTVSENLKGFPTGPKDIRDVNLGTFDPKFAGGGIGLRFWCKGGSVHPMVELRLRDAKSKAVGDPGWCAFAAAVEAAAIDHFVSQLEHAPLKAGHTVRLDLGNT